MKKKQQEDIVPNDGQVEARIPVVEEYLNIAKEVIDTGKLRVKKTVEEKDVTVDTTISSDEIIVKRIEMNQPVASAPPAVRYEGDTMIVSVVREELVVQRRLILAEEVHITKRRSEKDIQEPFQIRKEKITIDHEPNTGIDERK